MATPPIVNYPNAIVRNLRDKLGEHPSVLDFGMVADGTTDNTPFLQLAINSMVARGGGTLRVPASLTGQPYLLKTPVLISSVVPLTLEGEGSASIIKRGASIAAGFGLFDISGAEDVSFRDLIIDGGTTVSTGLLYSAIPGSDPMADILSQNTTFWVHGGATLKWERVTVQHTSGYAILLDARTVNITDVQIVDCKFLNNRQYLFGFSPGDLNYGSWTGGIFYKNDGVTHTTSVINLIVRGCRFERNTGNCVWGHGYGIAAQHQNVKIDYNYFLDCGLDGILHGNTVTGSANGNNFRRVGHICTDDTSPSTPKFLNGAFATALDTTGIAKDVTYIGNAFCSVNGDYINGDGFGHGVISNNTMRMPIAGDPEYTEDNIAMYGPSGTGVVSQGIIMNNSIDLPESDAYVLVTGNRMHNLPGTNIGMYGSRYCTVVGNFLFLPASMNGGQFPIALGNVGTTTNKRAYGNVVTDNVIVFNPLTSQACVVEDSQFAAFSGGDANWVARNTISTSTGNAYEFKKDTNTSSVTATVFSSQAAGLAQPSTHFLQREGSGTGSALKTYYVENTNLFQHAQFQAYSLGTSTRSPLFNVSEAGTGGAFTTGARTLMPFVDVMATGKLYGDAFLVLTDNTYTDAAANLLNSVVGGGSTGTAVQALLRYKGSVGQLEASTSISSGVRVWSSLVGGGGFWTLTGSSLYPSTTSWNVLIGQTTDDGTTYKLQVKGSVSLTGNNLGNGTALIKLDTYATQGQVPGSGAFGDSTIMDNQGFEGNFVRIKAQGNLTPSGDYFDWTRWGTSTLPLPLHVVQLRDSSSKVIMNFDGLGSSVAGSLGTGVFSFFDHVWINRSTDDASGANLQVKGSISLTGNNLGNGLALLKLDTYPTQNQVPGSGANGDSSIVDNQGFEGGIFRIKAKMQLTPTGDYFDWTRCTNTFTAALPVHVVQFRDSSGNVLINYDGFGGSVTGVIGTGVWSFFDHVWINRSTDDASGANLQVKGSISLTGNNLGNGTALIRQDVYSGQGQVPGSGANGDSTIMDNQGFEGNFMRIKAQGNLTPTGDYFDWTRWGTSTLPLPLHVVQFRDSSSRVLINYDGLGSSVSGAIGSGVFSFFDHVWINRTTDDGSGANLQVSGGINATSTVQSPIIRINNGSDFFSWTNNGLGTHHFQIVDSSANAIFDYTSNGLPHWQEGVYTVVGNINLGQLNTAGPTTYNAGALKVYGNAAALYFYRRDLTSLTGNPGDAWGWYNNLGVATLWTTTTGDLFTYSTAGKFTAAGDIDTSSGLYRINNRSVFRLSGTTLQWSTDNGSTWNTFTIGGGGVPSITGTANQVLANGTSGVAQTTAVTLTTPQDIGTASTVRFGALLINQANDGSGYLVQVNGGIEMTGTANNILSKGTANNAISANAGGITATTGYWIGGTQVVNSSGQWVGTTIVTSASAGSGISVSPSSGAITITNTGVTFLSAGTSISLTANTGSLTVSVVQDVSTTAVVRHGGMLVNMANNGSGFAMQVTGGIYLATGTYHADASFNNTVDIPNGGVTAKFLITTGAGSLYVGTGGVQFDGKLNFYGGGGGTSPTSGASLGFIIVAVNGVDRKIEYFAT